MATRKSNPQELLFQRADDLRRCPKCRTQKPRDGFSRDHTTRDGLNSWCRQCCAVTRKARFDRDPEAFRAGQRAYWGRPESGRGAKLRAWHAANPVSALLERAKRRAVRKCVQFTISAKDILPLPVVCPILGIPLRKGTWTRDPNAYSLDRIKPALGYVPGNVAVISNRANTIKNDATPEELHALSLWIKTVASDHESICEDLAA
jgi:hypothetical protein